MIIIAELASSHGGDVVLAADMIRAAADAGADYVKFQTYRKEAITPTDPQRAWLEQAHLDKTAHETLMRVCEDAGIAFLSTPFDAESLQMLRELGLKTFKIASSESGNGWWEQKAGERWYVSYPWGVVPDRRLSAWTFRQAPVPHDDSRCVRLTAIPLYPTPLECVGRATLLDGWSDHTEGISACQWAIAQGAKVIELHLKLPGRSRERCWDKSPQEIRQLRDFADACETMRSGVGQVFRDRWRRA